MNVNLPTSPYTYIVPNGQNKDIVEKLLGLDDFRKFNNKTHSSDKKGLLYLKKAEKELNKTNLDSMYTKNQYLNCLKNVKDQWIEERINKNEENISVKSYKNDRDGSAHRTDITVKVDSLEKELKKHFNLKSDKRKASTNALLSDVFVEPKKHNLKKIEMEVNLESVPLKARIKFKDGENRYKNCNRLEILLNSEENKKICYALTNQEEFGFFFDNTDIIEEHRNRMKECEGDRYKSYPKEVIKTYLDTLDEYHVEFLQTFNNVET